MKLLQKLIGLMFLFAIQNLAYAADLKIVTTLPALGQIAQGVAGEFAEVKVLAHVGQDPHFVPPKPTLARHLARADLLIAAGLGLEMGWLPPLLEASRNDSIQPSSEGYLDGTQVLTQVLGKPQGKISRALGDIHAEGNPHWWMDPFNGVRLAKILAVRLAKLDPQHADTYHQRAASFSAQIKARIPVWQQALQNMNPLVSYHDSYLYLRQRFTLQVSGFIEPKPGIEPSTSHLDRLVNHMQTNKVKSIWFESYHDGAMVRKVCELSHIPCRVMPDAIKGEGFTAYIQMFDTIAAGGK